MSLDGVRGLLRGLAIPATGLSAQRKRLDMIAMNIANAETTKTPEGGPYRRRVLELQEAQTLEHPAYSTPTMRRAGIQVPEVPEVPPVGSFPAVAEAAFGVELGEVREVAGEGPLVYEPGHPDADEAGYVRYPNVQIAQEMIDLMDARRSYEANATVFDAMKSMLRRAIQI